MKILDNIELYDTEQEKWVTWGDGVVPVEANPDLEGQQTENIDSLQVGNQNYNIPNSPMTLQGSAESEATEIKGIMIDGDLYRFPDSFLGEEGVLVRLSDLNAHPELLPLLTKEEYDKHLLYDGGQGALVYVTEGPATIGVQEGKNFQDYSADLGYGLSILSGNTIPGVDKIYIVPSGAPEEEGRFVDEYNIVDQTIAKAKFQPEKPLIFTAIAHDKSTKNTYLVGGVNPATGGESHIAQNQIYKFSENAGFEKLNLNLPQPEALGRAAVFNGVLYNFHRFYNNTETGELDISNVGLKLYKINLDTLEITETNIEAPGKDGATPITNYLGPILVNDKFYFFSGTKEEGKVPAKVLIFDTKTEQYETYNLNCRLDGGQMRVFSLNGFVILAGEDVDAPPNSREASKFCLFDPYNLLCGPLMELDFGAAVPSVDAGDGTIMGVTTRSGVISGSETVFEGGLPYGEVWVMSTSTPIGEMGTTFYSIIAPKSFVYGIVQGGKSNV